MGALSGPSFALEVARGQPTTLTIAATDAGFASETASALNSPRLRIYSSGDPQNFKLTPSVARQNSKVGSGRSSLVQST